MGVIAELLDHQWGNTCADVRMSQKRCASAHGGGGVQTDRELFHGRLEKSTLRNQH
jgi:hypothetical protein